MADPIFKGLKNIACMLKKKEKRQHKLKVI